MRVLPTDSPRRSKQVVSMAGGKLEQNYVYLKMVS